MSAARSRTGWARARAAAEELRDVSPPRRRPRERARETGTRGEGGDRTLEIDAAAEDGRLPPARRLHADGAPRSRPSARSAARVDFGFARRPVRGHRPDRRVAERQARPAAPRALDRRRRRRRRWPTSSSASSTTSGRTRSGSRGAAGARSSTARGWTPAPRERRVARQARAASGSSRPIRAGCATSPTGSPTRPTACARWARSPSRSARSPPRGWTAWSRCAAAARSTSRRRS